MALDSLFDIFTPKLRETFQQDAEQYLYSLAGPESNQVITKLLIMGMNLMHREERSGFFELLRDEGRFGIAGPNGNFRLDKVMTKPAEADQFLQFGHMEHSLVLALSALEKEKHTKMLPCIDYNCRKTDFPLRNSEDPVVRILLFPNHKYRDSKYLDVHLSQAKAWAIPPIEHSDSARVVTPLLSLVKDGVLPEGCGNDRQWKSLDTWFDQTDEEPPWVVLSMGEENKSWLRDPRLLAHIHFLTESESEVDDPAVLVCQGEFGHVGADGQKAERVLDAITRQATTRLSKEELQQGEWLEWTKDPLTWWWNRLKTSVERTPEIWQQKNYETDITSDPLMQEWIKKVNFTEVEVKGIWPKDFIKFVTKWAIKGYQKPANLWSLAVAMVGGQQALMPVASDNGLQIMLGLGGEDILSRTRKMIYALRYGSKNQDQNPILKKRPDLTGTRWGETEWNDLKGYFSWWKDSGWNESFVKQLNWAKQGKGLVTWTLAAVGAQMRSSVQKMSGAFESRVTNAFNSRWMVSQLGKGEFATAVSQSTGVVVGVTDEAVWLRASAKDPVLMWEVLIRMMKSDSTLAGDFARNVDTLSSQQEKDLMATYKLDPELWNLTKDWLHNLISSSVRQQYQSSDQEAGVQKIPFGELRFWDGKQYVTKALPAMGWIRRIGEDVTTRHQVIEAARALVAITLPSINQSLGTKMERAFVAMMKSKVGWMTSYILELCALQIKQETMNTHESSVGVPGLDNASEAVVEQTRALVSEIYRSLAVATI